MALKHGADDPGQLRHKRALLAIRKLQERIAELEAGGSRPAAIVGIGCRLPGGVHGPRQLWRLLEAGEDAVAEVPPERWDAAAFHSDDPTAPGRMVTRRAGLLDAVDRFDPHYFGLSPREARGMDPQQRLMLEVTAEALEDGGLPRERLAGRPVGLFVGVAESEYAWITRGERRLADAYTATGAYGGIVANRVSYLYDLRGPSFTVDSICSSSLLALHLACRSLSSGESEAAIVGGAVVLTGPDQMLWLSKLGVVSPAGRCRAFDAGGDGIVLGEGVVSIVLKPLERARADGDRIYAVVRGTAVSQDGRSNGLTAPTRRAQVEMLERAYRSAGIEPRRVQYVDAHGTGTPLGDPVEASALGAVVGAERGAGDPPCGLGSVKTNLGHLGPVGGLASVLKVALAMHAGRLPASLHFERPNPRIPFAELGLEVVREGAEWPAVDGRRIGGVNSLAFGGTNVHAVLTWDEADAAGAPSAPSVEAEAAAEADAQADSDAAGRPSGAFLLPLSAASPSALEELVRRWRDEPPTGGLRDVAYTAAVRRSHLDHRLVLRFADRDGLAAALGDAAEGRLGPSVVAGQIRDAGGATAPVFVFSGQGGQHPAMGRELYGSDPAFRETVDACDRVMEPLLGWSVASALADPDPDLDPDLDIDLDAVERAQPLIFAVQVGLAAVWRRWGVVPAAVVGHSVGEVAAAVAAGALDLEDGARVVCRRSAALARLAGTGAMLSTDSPRERLEELIETVTETLTEESGGSLAVAAVNGRRSVVVAGGTAEVEALAARLEADGAFHRRVRVDVASHTPAVEPLLGPLREALAGLEPRPPERPFVSTVTGRLEPEARLDADCLDADYWARNLRSPVRFDAALEACLAEGYRWFVEIGPHPTLAPAVEEGFRDAGVDGRVLASLHRERSPGSTLDEALSRLHVAGFTADWRGVVGEGRLVDLPAYPWQRQRLWLDAGVDVGAAAGDGAAAPRAGAGEGRHPLLAERLDPPVPGGAVHWRLAPAPGTAERLRQHRLRGLALMPAACWLEASASAVGELTGAAAVDLLDFELERACGLDPLPGELFLTLTPTAPGTFRCVVAERRGEGEGTVFARGLAAVAEVADGASADAPSIGATADEAPSIDAPSTDAPSIDIASDDADGEPAVSAEAFYRALERRGASYGELFRTVAGVWGGEGERVVRLRAGVPGTVPETEEPALLLDGTLQAALATLPDDGAVWIPRRIGRCRIRPAAGGGRLTVTVAGGRRWAGGWRVDALRADGGVGGVGGAEGGADGDGGPRFELRGVELVRPRGVGEAVPHGLLHAVSWEPAPARREGGTEGSGPFLLCGAGDDAAEPLLAALAARGLEARTVSIDEVSASEAGDATVVFLGALDVEDPEVAGVDGLRRAWHGPAGELLRLVRALARRRPAAGVWVVTAGARGPGAPAGGAGVVQGALWGLAWTLCLEHPELRPRLVDVGADRSAAAFDALAGELAAGAEGPAALALGDGERLCPRLVAAGVRPPVGECRDGDVVTLEAAPGSLDGLVAVRSALPEPGDGEICVEVDHAGLNFLDVALALGLLPSPWVEGGRLRFGLECCGRVVAVGPGVERWRAGDRVVAVAPRPSTVASHVALPAALAVPWPEELDAAQAATWAVPYLTAHLALVEAARLAAGERVLIHSAAGGVGHAALAVARRAGAEVIATAGSESRREHLRRLGCRAVLSSRGLDFADEVRRLTGGRGVDVVLNSLAGAAAERSLALLAEGGRFVEIGKRDAVTGGSLEARHLMGNRSFHAVDLAALLERAPGRVGALMAELLSALRGGELPPLPVEVLPLRRAADGFRRMARARHLGRVAFRAADRAGLPAVGGLGTRLAGPRLAAGSWLITGGTGGLGRAFAGWLIDAGVRHLALVARNPAAGEAAREIEGWRRRGVEVRVYRADAGDDGALAGVLDRLRGELPPLVGVIHGAAALTDGLLANLDGADVETAAAPKAHGAWTLHRLTGDDPLEFFVLLSSTASTLGHPGQGSYAAANAFVDGLAAYRRARGLPATVVAWGPWSRVGGVAERGLEERFRARGLGAIDPEEGVAALAALLEADVPAATVVRLDAGRYRRAHPYAARCLLPAPESGAGGTGAGAASAFDTASAVDWTAALHRGDGEARSLVLAEVRRAMAGVYGVPEESLAADVTFAELSFDSLMALQLRNLLERRLGLSLPATLVWNYPAPASLADHLVERLESELLEDAPR